MVFKQKAYNNITLAKELKRLNRKFPMPKPSEGDLEIESLEVRVENSNVKRVR